MLHSPNQYSRQDLREAIAAADRRRAMGNGVRHLELAHDGPVDPAARAAAEQADHAEAAALTPRERLRRQIVDAETYRNDALAEFGKIEQLLASDQSKDPTTVLILSRSDIGQSAAISSRACWEAEMAEQRDRAAAWARRAARLNGSLWALITGRAAERS